MSSQLLHSTPIRFFSIEKPPPSSTITPPPIEIPEVKSTRPGSREREHPIIASLFAMMNPSVKAILAAVVGNLLLFAGKMAAGIYTGSGVMFAEALHSLADTANQMLLLVGSLQSSKAPSSDHPYGFAVLKPAYALVSATGFFFLGGMISLGQAAVHMLEPPVMQHIHFSFAMLAVSLAVESLSLGYALRAIREQARGNKMSLLEYIKRGSDSSLLAIIVEDGAALAGIMVAATALTLTSLTGNVSWDTAGTFVVGIGLAYVAVFLVKRNFKILLGHQIQPDKLKKITDVLRATPAIKSVHDIKSFTVDGESHRFKAEVLYNGRVLARQALQTANGKVTVDALLTVMMHRRSGPPLSEAEMKALRSRVEGVLEQFGELVADELGEEVDRIEARILAVDKHITHIDLEPHAVPAEEVLPISPTSLLAEDKKQ